MKMGKITPNRREMGNITLAVELKSLVSYFIRCTPGLDINNRLHFPHLFLSRPKSHMWPTMSCLFFTPPMCKKSAQLGIEASSGLLVGTHVLYGAISSYPLESVKTDGQLVVPAVGTANGRVFGSPPKGTNGCVCMQRKT